MDSEFLSVYGNAAAVASAVLFWAGFLVFGLVAKRYNVVFNRSTFHALIMAAPSGILLYALLILARGAFFSNDAAVAAFLQNAGYAALLISAVSCLAGVMKFNALIGELLKYRGEK